MDTALHEACGIAAIYYLPGADAGRLGTAEGPEEISRLLPRMLLDVQNRGQLSAGFTTYNPHRRQLLETYKDVGTVSEVFRMTHKGKFESLMKKYAGQAAIGHVRYATCGQEDRSYAQPFERRHIKKHKWFSFAFNGQLANFPLLREKLLGDRDCYLAHETDTEILMHLFCNALHVPEAPSLIDLMRRVAEQIDGAYSLVFLDALGQMLVARDPLGFKPLAYAVEGPFFAAASESVALVNLGFRPENIHSLLPGYAILISGGQLEILPFTEAQTRAHCFFEWIYFSNVASTIDGRNVYLTRKALGEELAQLEDVPIDADTIVVPVPDTSKAAADAMAYRLGVPSVEGLIRNRYTGRTFIEGPDRRLAKAQIKYIPLREVLEGKRVLLVEDSIVRATTMKALLERMRDLGRPREIHVRVACPPIISPCFYGIDMSTLSELFAPKFLHGGPLTPEVQCEMAQSIGADSLRYLPVEAVARAIGLPAHHLCQACITGQYPTVWGARLAEVAAENARQGIPQRTYETAACQK